jgi:Ca2+-binding RTX toxin-like protein
LASSLYYTQLPVADVWADTIDCPPPPALCEGTERDDTISGLWVDNNVIIARGGNDVIRGGYADDQIYGGPGSDTVWAANGHDFVDGGPGNDLIDGLQGNDHLYGNDGSDDISGYSGDDMVTGGLGADRLFGGIDADRLSGNFLYEDFRDFAPDFMNCGLNAFRKDSVSGRSGDGDFEVNCELGGVGDS